MPVRFLTRMVYLFELASGTLLFLIYAPGLFQDSSSARAWTVVVWCFAIWWMRLEPNRISWLFHILADGVVCGLGLLLLFGAFQPLTDSEVRRDVLKAPESFGMAVFHAIVFLAPGFVAFVFLLNDGESFSRPRSRGAVLK